MADTKASCPKSPLGVSLCALDLKASMQQAAAEQGDTCEIHVSTLPPLVQGAYELVGYRCPHGTEYWIEPTGEQIADWAARGVR